MRLGTPFFFAPHVRSPFCPTAVFPAVHTALLPANPPISSLAQLGTTETVDLPVEITDAIDFFVRVISSVCGGSYGASSLRNPAGIWWGVILLRSQSVWGHHSAFGAATARLGSSQREPIVNSTIWPVAQCDLFRYKIDHLRGRQGGAKFPCLVCPPPPKAVQEAFTHFLVSEEGACLAFG